MSKNTPPTTPDGRYIVVKGTLWRATNPHLDAETRQRHVDALMDARRDVKRHQQDAQALAEARSRVQAAKEALGERGPVWWQDGAPCLNRHKVHLTPYAGWYAARSTATKEQP
jgi:hypothetical protein